MAGDVLTAEEIAAAFGNAQETACSHSTGRLLAILSRLLFRDLYQIIRFYRRSTETTDVEGTRSEFSGTDFSSFLDETEWKNEDLAYENFGDLERVLGKSIVGELGYSRIGLGMANVGKAEDTDVSNSCST